MLHLFPFQSCKNDNCLMVHLFFIKTCFFVNVTFSLLEKYNSENLNSPIKTRLTKQMWLYQLGLSIFEHSKGSLFDISPSTTKTLSAFLCRNGFHSAETWGNIPYSSSLHYVSSTKALIYQKFTLVKIGANCTVSQNQALSDLLTWRTENLEC